MLRVTIVHAATYFVVGIVAAAVIDYPRLFELPVIGDYMKPFGSVSVFLGPVVQLLRGAILGFVLLALRGTISQRRGWLWLWLVLVGVGILSTYAAAPSSIEGLVYTALPLWYHLIGLPEMLIQTLIFSILINLMERHPEGLIAALPPLARRIAGSGMVALMAFAAYAVISVLFAVIAGAAVDAGENLTIRVQGIFLAPFLINGAIAMSLHPFTRTVRTAVLAAGLSFALSAAAVLVYQAIVGGNVDPTYALIAPLLPAAVVGLLVPARRTLASDTTKVSRAASPHEQRERLEDRNAG